MVTASKWVTPPSTGIIPPVEPDSNEANPSSPWVLVNSKFDSTMAMADDMLAKLVGTAGDGGYLGTLNDLVQSIDIPDSLADLDLNIANPELITDTRPDLSSVDINTEFPTFSEPEPSPLALPLINLSDIQVADLPSNVQASINYLASQYNSDIINPLLTRVLTDIQTGATGLDPVIEQEIWERALSRQAIETERKYNEVEQYFEARGYKMPPGALAGGLLEANAEALRANTDINGKIAISQAELAQKNSQFILAQATTIESLLRDFYAKNEDRELDFQKALALLVVQNYSESVKAYIAKTQADTAYVQIQVENLRAIVEYNRGLFDTYKAQLEAFGINVEAIAKQNESLVNVYEADIAGYEAETKALTANQLAIIETHKAKLQAADLKLREAIARLEAETQSYTTEASLKERISNDMAQIASQAVTAALNAVNVSASLGYSGSESQSESWSHSESISEAHSISGSLSETHSYEEEPTT